jgi:Domain of unknown function (DUF4440)
MKNPVWLLLLTSVIVMSGCASVTSDRTPPAGTALSEVEALERARFKALIAADLAALRPMLAEDLVYCHSSGVCQNKEEFLGFLSGNKYLGMDIVYMKPRLVDGAVLINGRVNVRVEEGGTAKEFPGIYTDVYAKRGGRWQLVSWQSTRAPAK